MRNARPEGPALAPQRITRQRSGVATVEELVAAVLPQLENVSGAKNLSARCPFPDHEDRSASFSLNRLSGLWKCHGSCARQGNAYQLAKELGCLPATASSRTSSPRTPDWGLDLERFGVKVTDRAVVFPIIDHDGNRCRDHARLHSGSPRFQYWGKGRVYHACVPSWELVREWGRGCGVAFVVEGNRDALALAAHGWPSIGVLGVEHFDHALEDVAGPLRDIGIGALVLTPDNDDAGIKAVAEWAPKLEALGFAVGIRRLPESVNGHSVKDTFDLYDAGRDSFEDWMHELPVWWRA